MNEFRDAVERLKAKFTTPEHLAWVEEEARREEEEVRRNTQASMEARWRAAGIPERTIDVLRTGPDGRSSFAAVRDWLKSDRTFLVLAGNTGTGKTIAAGWAVAEGRGLFRKARYVAWIGQYEQDAREQVIRAPLLALDDLGTEPLDQGGWALSMLYAVLDARYDAKARTLITTNLGFDAIAARYGNDGGRLFRRLREAGDWLEVAA